MLLDRTTPLNTNDAPQNAAHEDTRSSMVWLSDLDTPEGRDKAEAVSASLDGQPNVYDLFAVRVMMMP